MPPVKLTPVTHTSKQSYKHKHSLSDTSEAHSSYTHTHAHKLNKNTYSVPPVKLTPARWGEDVIVSPKSGPEQGRKLHTPGGSPASCAILKTVQLESTAVLDGFQRLTLPMRVGVMLRFPPMAVKLKGVTAAMNPSSPLSSMRFQTLVEWCSGWIWGRRNTLQ